MVLSKTKPSEEMSGAVLFTRILFTKILEVVDFLPSSLTKNIGLFV